MTVPKFATAADNKSVKPVVEMVDATVGRHPYYRDEVIFGVPSNHPNTRLNGRYITSSPIVKQDGDIIETRNTIYKVLNWAEKDGA